MADPERLLDQLCSTSQHASQLDDNARQRLLDGLRSCARSLQQPAFTTNPTAYDQHNNDIQGSLSSKVDPSPSSERSRSNISNATDERLRIDMSKTNSQQQPIETLSPWHLDPTADFSNSFQLDWNAYSADLEIPINSTLEFSDGPDNVSSLGDPPYGYFDSDANRGQQGNNIYDRTMDNSASMFSAFAEGENGSASRISQNFPGYNSTDSVHFADVSNNTATAYYPNHILTQDERQALDLHENFSPPDSIRRSADAANDRKRHHFPTKPLQSEKRQKVAERRRLRACYLCKLNKQEVPLLTSIEYLALY